MPFGAVILRPGVNVERTLSANEAGISQSQLMRYKTGELQTYGGWSQYVKFILPSTVRDLHAWQGLTSNQFLGIGATKNLSVINSGALTDITPQTTLTNPTPNFSISSNAGNVVTITDASSLTTNDVVFFNTPVAIGNMLLNGAYPINSVLSSSRYTILSSVAASTTITSSGILPIFDVTNGSPIVDVILPNNGVTVATGLFVQFIAGTTIGSQTIQGTYQPKTIIDSTTFTIHLTAQATQTSSFTMNGGNAQLLYYIAGGALAPGGGYGSGNYGAGPYGQGTGSGGAPGTPITATDWTLDNWGEVLLACPENGPIYAWSPDSGLQQAQVVNQAPFFNGGIFVSQPQQILVAWRSVQTTGVQDPLIVRWSNATDYTNWTVSNQTVAGAFHLPTGSLVMGGLQGPNFAMIWTDIDAWVMSYVGGTVVFNFTRVGAGCGLIGKHAACILGGIIYWVSPNNFFMNGPTGVSPIPCTVWDFIFQNLNTAFQTKVRLASNSAFNEITCFFPSNNSTGENDSYVKAHIEGGEFEWDYGTLARTAWIDLSILGNPIATDPLGNVYQHETGNAFIGAAAPFFRSGWWTISEGEELSFVDFIIPDFIWGTFGAAQNSVVLMTFFSVNYPGDTPISYGPFTVTQATEYINIRLRGRLMSVLVQSSAAEFWRLGRIRFRYSASGRR